MWRISNHIIYIYMGVIQNYFAWGTPPIAGQSRSNRGPAESNRGATLGIEFSRLISGAGLPAYSWKQEGGDVARMGRGSLVELVQSPSNRRPIAVQSRSNHGIRRQNFGLLLADLASKQIWKALSGPAQTKSTSWTPKGTLARARAVKISAMCVGTMQRLNSYNCVALSRSNRRPFAARVLPIVLFNKLPLFINFRHAITVGPHTYYVYIYIYIYIGSCVGDRVGSCGYVS